MASSIADISSFQNAIFYSSQSIKTLHHVMGELIHPLGMALDSIFHMPFWIMLFSLLATGAIFHKGMQSLVTKKFKRIGEILVNKFYIDCFVECILVPAVLWISRTFRYQGDEKFVDRGIVMGIGSVFPRVSGLIKSYVSGYLYHYASLMLIGLFVFIYYVVII